MLHTPAIISSLIIYQPLHGAVSLCDSNPGLGHCSHADVSKGRGQQVQEASNGMKVLQVFQLCCTISRCFIWRTQHIKHGTSNV